MTATLSAPPPACDSHFGGHPLEMIPWFRRWRRGLLRDFIYTLIWNSLFAVGFSGIALLFDRGVHVLEALRVNMVFAQCIGFAIYGLFVLGDRVFPGIHQRSKAVRVAYYAFVPIVGVFLGYWLSSELLGFGGFQSWLFTLRGFSAVAILSLIITGILLMIFVPRERAARAEAEVAREQSRVTAAEKEATTARLKLLEAQIEPHFLYNTLANAISLVDTAPELAKRTIERLIDLLRASASSDGDGTLGEQLQWLRAYLDILALRMGTRLEWNIDVPADLMALHLPGMLLQPLVENAVKHGLEPKVEGGRLEIVARRQGALIRLTVRDTGLGFRTTSREAATGIGLPNLRARLAARYGQAAQLVIEDNTPSGASVSVVVPAAG